MKKGQKIILIVVGILVGIIILDTLQAKIFDNSPLIKIRKSYYLERNKICLFYQRNFFK